MAKTIKKNGKVVYQCELCLMYYRIKTLAEKCEAWCKRTGTCNIEISKKAVYVPGLPDSFREKLDKVGIPLGREAMIIWRFIDCAHIMLSFGLRFGIKFIVWSTYKFSNLYFESKHFLI